MFSIYLHCLTELCDGGNLYDYVMDKAKPLELELAKKWAISIAKGELCNMCILIFCIHLATLLGSGQV